MLNIAFSSVIGAAGVALSSSVTGTLLIIFLAWRLTELRATGSIGALWRTFGHSLVAIAIPALPIAALAWSGIVGGDQFPAFPALGILGSAALAAYAFIIRRMGYPEVDVLIRASLDRSAGYRLPTTPGAGDSTAAVGRHDERINVAGRFDYPRSS